MDRPKIETSVTLSTEPINEVEADVIVVSAGSKGGLRGSASEVNSAVGGALELAVSAGGFKGAAFETEWIFPAPNLRAKRVLLLGSGKTDQFGAQELRHLAMAAVRLARRKGARRILLALTPPEGVDTAKAVELMTDGALSALYDSALYKDSPERPRVEEISIWAGGADSSDLVGAVSRGRKIASAVNMARWLGDEPSNIMTTLRFGEEARAMAEEAGVSFELLEEKQLRELGMNLLLSVADGSQYPAYVAVLTYKGSDKGPTLGLVGKGVVFDTGGISIKSAQDMHYMKYDMCGAADVVAATCALARLQSPVNVIAVAGLVENMPGGRATRPGDVVRAANGKTVEIINTDAEGRLVLADCLDLAIKRGADRLVDVATLTGAIKVALGDVATGVMGRPQSWVDSLLAAAKEAGETAWQMPVFPQYRDKLKSNIADLMNTGGRAGGAVNAAAFLEQFAGDKPWVHLDVAGTAWTERDTPYQLKGATGSMIRSIIALAEQVAKEGS